MTSPVPDPPLPQFKITIELEPTLAWSHRHAREAAQRAADAIEQLTSEVEVFEGRPLLEIKRVLVERLPESY